MPGNANAAERGWLRMAIIGLVAVQIFAPGREAFGGQSQSQIPVSAFVVVSSTIAATLSATIAPGPAQTVSTPTANTQSGNPPGAPADAPNAPALKICTSVAVNCSGRSPMRVSIDNAVRENGNESPNAVQECSAQAQNSLSLCAAGANGPAGSLGLNIEY